MNKSYQTELEYPLRTPANDPRIGIVASALPQTRTDIRDQQSVTMSLFAKPLSTKAVTAIDDLVRIAHVPNGRPRRPSPKYIMAVGTIIADTLKGASYMPSRPCYRPMASKAFTGQPIGREPFRRALRDLEARQFVEVEDGKRGLGDEPGHVTRISSTVRLTDYLGGYGITPSACRSHFHYPRVAEYVRPIQLRASSKGKGRNKLQGERMKVDWSNPEVKRQAARMRAINAFIAKHDITGPEAGNLDDIFLYRSFNNGDQPGHNYKQGGRMYVYGGGYQALKQRKEGQRSLIKFDGEDTVEVDISACFLTLAYSMLGMIPPDLDNPYLGPNYPRPIIKAWMNMTWSNPTFHKSWPSEVVNDLEDEEADERFSLVRKTYPIAKVRDSIRLSFPVVDAWMNSDFTWADLHYKESEIMLEVMEVVAFKHGVVSLPIHDSLRVATTKSDIVMRVLKETFLHHTGYLPKLSTK